MSLVFNQKITLDLTISRVQNVHCSQDDVDSRNILITLSDNGKPYSIPSEVSIFLKISKPNNTYVYIDEDDVDHLFRNDDGTISVILPEQATVTSGICESEIQLINTSTKEVISTAKFNIIVKKSVLSDEEIESSIDSNIVKKMIYHLVDFNNPHRIPDATTTGVKGLTKLEDSVTSNSTTTAATPNSVKTTYDKLLTEEERAKKAERTIQDQLDKNKPIWDDKLDKTGDASNVTNTITTASSRINLSTGEKLSLSLGKISKWFSDLKTVAFSGSYNDLSNKPTSLPANGGDSTTAIKLKTARKINGISFDGTKDITVPLVGSIESADKLSTARKINNTSFDGTADIRLEDSYNYKFGVTDNSASYIIFARTLKENELGECTGTFIVSGTGNYGGVNSGTYLVSISNRGSKATMKAICLQKNLSNEIQFGFYSDDTCFYFGAYRPAYSYGTTITVLNHSNNMGIGYIYNSTILPDGAEWTTVDIQNIVDVNDIGAVADHGGKLYDGSLLGGRIYPVSDDTLLSINGLYTDPLDNNKKGINIGCCPGVVRPTTGFAITSTDINVFGNMQFKKSLHFDKDVENSDYYINAVGGAKLHGINSDSSNYLSGTTYFGGSTYYINKDAVAYLKGGKFDNTITLMGGFSSKNSVYMANNKILYADNSNGTARNLLQFTNGNVLYIGYGPYAAKEGKTVICGNNVEICFMRNSGAGISYRPYFKPGDSAQVLIRTSGYITGGSKNVRFTVSLSRPAIGVSSVSVSSISGLCVRQANKYCYGATSSTLVAPSSYSASLNTEGTAINIDATMQNTTNVTTNNDACGVDASIGITFS